MSAFPHGYQASVASPKHWRQVKQFEIGLLNEITSFATSSSFQNPRSIDALFSFISALSDAVISSAPVFHAVEPLPPTRQAADAADNDDFSAHLMRGKGRETSEIWAWSLLRAGEEFPAVGLPPLVLLLPPASPSARHPTVTVQWGSVDERDEEGKEGRPILPEGEKEIPNQGTSSYSSGDEGKEEEKKKCADATRSAS
ncbi:unnamed protein product [Heligmosomoides polygyrus]|uniref:Uncharacterized protein n=1 Tax=Heligmosomoides polygyrus TaxID=6339 RepID=A0A183F925_HELPZ|nr:unnamed protein product [Heligmosomoides polygyrus]